ncbi:CLUMA_CG003954, isoform A [Clunio marinus]|uniref:Transporter n=1 Tax=Clunio marinus TaxID=568069 RepID=A0A1J1HQJ1_9DIPT|nr:CLUMA_CG003954, isoform A [Clunio marinus]
MGKTGIYNVGFVNSTESVNIKTKPRIEIPNVVVSTIENVVAKVETPDDDGRKRPQWSNSLEFLMSCISVSVGLGNIWRFPFTAYENGGGAFLIPYIIVLMLIGKPIYYLEMAIGQFSSRGSVKALSVIPALQGVAIAQQVGTTCVVTYYCSLIALTLSYMFRSFAAELPWAKCLPKWSEETSVQCIDATSNSTNRTGSVSSSELFFLREVIKQKDDISDGIGFPDWQLTLWLLLAWIIVFLVIVKGVKSSGKFAYFLAIFPYVVMLILLARALTLEGAMDGIKFFITPNFKRLLEPQVWNDAVTQLFFSLAIGMGPLIMFSSYNDFQHNLFRDAMIVTTLDTFTSLLGGFTIFGILGNLAHNVGEPDVGNIIKSGGSGIAFISYPEAISQFTFVPQVFAVLFFFMLLALGVGSAVGLQSSIVTNLLDIFPKTKHWQMAGGCCLGGFIIGLIYVTPGGQWMLTLIDHFGGTFLIFALAIMELIGIFWIYGLENFCWDLEFMLNRKVTPFWRISWFVVTPVLMIVIFVYSMAKLENPLFAGKEYPESNIVAGWCIFVFGMAQLFIWAIWNASREGFGNAKTSKFVSLFKPDPEWGPKSSKTRKEWISFKEVKMENRRNLSTGHSKLKQIFLMLLGRYE